MGHEPRPGAAARRPALRGGIADRGVIKTGRVRRWWRSVEALPGVQPNMVVITACAQECRRRTHPSRHLEPQHARVKRYRSIEVGNLEVHVADVDPGIDSAPPCPIIARMTRRCASRLSSLMS